MEELRQEEGKLRDQLLDALKEMERVTRELEQTSERLEDSEKLNQRYQKELESVEGLHHKLAEYESKGIMSPEEQKFTREKMLRIELENKELKDQNDELAVELEQVKLQGAPPRKVLEPASPERGTHPPAREGSVMSHYVRPVVVKRALGSPYGTRLFKKYKGVGETLDKDTIAKLRKEISELKDNFERERKDIEQSYKLEIAAIEKKYCKERDKAVSFAKSVKEQLNLANTSNKEDHEDKSRLAGMLEEKNHLEIQLQRVNDKLLESTTNFAVSQSQHVKELQQLKDQTTNMVDLQKYIKLQIELVDSQRSVRDLQEQINNREELVAKKMKESTDQHHQEIKELEEVKESLGRQLKTLQEVLDNQIEKYKEQFEAGEKRNALVVNLYKENADLMQALYHVEEQKKDAITKCYKLEDQCNNLRRMLKKMARVAIT